ncbi:MAG: GIY-YIG nuclease family protein [Clostridiales bacterium]|nr:GIY-YIG nuclease family protein [Clostridiales bacterium]
MEPHSWWAYMVQCADGTLYTGIAADVDRRAEVHNRGRGAKYTRSRLPVQVVYREEQPTKGDALRREMAIKRLSRREKLELIAGKDNPPHIPLDR